ncbi:MAG: alcohol dehydrogenase catalytic domain-containing protein [Nitrospirae bacterium]|nr:alcohol dehydrogenase catalytic domain-containing protein [Nitrospirota bacterium]MDA1303785.1 alcohol dehydrogenase catalytic domain-containing protein [Nitrospirota bacterium]
MRALRLDSALQFEANQINPTPPPGEALIRVHQAGVCATDLQLVKGYMGFQGILGHEFVGTVEQAAGHEYLSGKRVVGEINAACRTCATCQAGHLTHCPNRTTLGIDRRDGAFADFLCLPVENLYPLPDEISNDQAVFIEPLAAACQILEQVSIVPTDRVVVIGDGKLGLLCAQVLRTTNCQLTIIGRHQEKLALLKHHGIQTTVNVEDVSPGADIVIEATGSPDGLKLANQLLRPKGTLVLKSTYHGQTTFDFTSLVINEITIVGSRCGPFPQAIKLLQKNSVSVEPLIRVRYSINQGVEAIERAATSGTLKVLLTMD